MINKSNPENKLIITAALCGSGPRKEQNPAVPYTPEEFGDEAKKCFDAGAAIVHVHARNAAKEGIPTKDLEIIKAIIEKIKEKAPEIIINLSTGVRPFELDEERITPIIKFKPPIASLNTNSMNFARGNYKTGEIIADAERIFKNSFNTIQKFAREMKKVKSKPEMEIYDIGGMYNMLFLNKKDGFFEQPLHFQFVFGVLGGMPFTPFNLAALLHIMPPDAIWSVCGIAKQQFHAGLTAAASGGHIRIGLEDNIRMPNGELAKGSWEQVKWAAKAAEMVGREVAQGEEAHEILNLLRNDVELS